jgi:inorganic pyrophosphatase
MTIQLPEPFQDDGQTLNVIIETPRDCRNKYKFNHQLGLFELSGVLPAGASFPYDFGFVPRTIAADGDPLDVLVLMDEPAFTGCLISSRIVGVMEANQTEDGKAFRNDRLVAAAKDAHDYRNLKSLKDMNKNLLDELAHFFESYNDMRGKRFEILSFASGKKAHRLVEQAIKRAS